MKSPSAPSRFAPKIVGALLVASALLTAEGCGSGSDLTLAEVRGKVSYKGKSLEKGQVVLIPTGATPGPQSDGDIGSDGSFRIMTGGVHGAAVGTHKVTVHYREELTEAQIKNLVIPKLLIPAKYAEESLTPLSVDVKQGQTNELNIELTD